MRSAPYLRPALFAPLMLAVAAGLYAWAFSRLTICTDILRAMPETDSQLTAMQTFLQEHPLPNRVALNLAVAHPNHADVLMESAASAAAALNASGVLWVPEPAQVGEVFESWTNEVLEHLPYFFSARAIRDELAPRLTADALSEHFLELRERLMTVDATLRGDWLAADPLGLRELVWARLSAIRPAEGRLHQGRLMSADGRHVLLLANPVRRAGVGPAPSEIAAVVSELSETLEHRYRESGLRVNAVGAYRAALDNERLARSDIERISIVAGVGLLFLLMIAFRRRWLGPLALVGTAVGGGAGLLAFSFIRDDISVLALGFGGAVLAISVDHSIAFCVLLDRRQPITGKEVSHALFRVGGLAAVTTVVAFALLTLSGFPLLSQVGLLASLSVGAAFLCIHLLLPFLFPLPLSPTAPKRAINWWRRWVRFRRPAAAVSLILLLCCLPFVTTRFDVDLSAYNTVSEATKGAEEELAAVWGPVLQQKAVVVSGGTSAEFTRRLSALASRMTRWHESHFVGSPLAPTDLVPQGAVAQSNLTAWKTYFDSTRLSALRRTAVAAAEAAGFAPELVGQSIDRFASPPADVRVSLALFEVLGLLTSYGDGRHAIVWPLESAPGYSAEAISNDLGDPDAPVLLDGEYYGRRLSEMLGGVFLRMLALVAAGSLLMLALALRSITRVAFAVLPLICALVATLGVLGSLGRAIEMPGIMLGVFVFGVGVDYALFVLRSHECHHSSSDEDLVSFHVSVTVAALSTLIGLGSLAVGGHELLSGAGTVLVLGVGFSFWFAIVCLPEALLLLSPSPGRDEARGKT